MLDREVFVASSIPDVEIIDDVDAVRFNSRAAEQRGLFIRVGTIEESLEDLFGSYLTRYDIPRSERLAALGELDDMLVTARTLFRDLDGAARTAALRVLDLGTA